MSGEKFLSSLVLLSAAAIMLALTVNAHHDMAEARATECSEMLHETIEASSIEVGACLLQFNQPLVTGVSE